MHEVPVNRSGSLTLPRKSMVRLTDRPDINLDIYRGRKTTTQQQQQQQILAQGRTCLYTYTLVFASLPESVVTNIHVYLHKGIRVYTHTLEYLTQL